MVFVARNLLNTFAIHLSSMQLSIESTAMKKQRHTTIGFRNSDGTISDEKFHEEIMRGVDDTSLRIMSAQRVIAMGFTREETEELFSVKLPDDGASI